MTTNKKNPNLEIFPWDQTEDLSGSFHPNPKPIKGKKDKKPLKKIGKQGEENMAANAELLKTAVKMGITKCEVKLDGCWKIVMGFAHSKKRRNLTPEELKTEAICACNPCHEKIEYDCEKWTNMSMEQFVRMTIKERINK